MLAICVQWLTEPLVSSRETYVSVPKTSMRHPVIEYGSSVWDTHGVVRQENLERVHCQICIREQQL